MTTMYRVRIEGETHRIRIEAPENPTEESLEELRQFAISSALLEHFGYLPKGVLHGTD